MLPEHQATLEQESTAIAQVSIKRLEVASVRVFNWRAGGRGSITENDRSHFWVEMTAVFDCQPFHPFWVERLAICCVRSEMFCVVGAEASDKARMLCSVKQSALAH